MIPYGELVCGIGYSPRQYNESCSWGEFLGFSVGHNSIDSGT